MPINIPDNLPATEALKHENIFYMTDATAAHQDIRPLRIAILNLMPKKIETETQILRLLSNSPIQVDIEFLQTASHVSKNTPISHLNKFYTTFDNVKNERFDGLIITGAPVEQMEFEDVDYWKEQMFGVFPHVIEMPYHPLVRGFDEKFFVPHSRHTEVRREDIEKISSLEILTSSPISGVHIVGDKSHRLFFVTGHSEYDRFTLRDEYMRDYDKGLPIKKPYNYFPYDDVGQPPHFNWRCHANMMFSNWVNYCVYQETPYDLGNLEPIKIEK